MKIVPITPPTGFFARILFKLRSWRFFKNFIEQPLVKKPYRSILKEKAKAAFVALPIHRNWVNNYSPPFSIRPSPTIYEHNRYLKSQYSRINKDRERAIAVLESLNSITNQQLKRK